MNVIFLDIDGVLNTDNYSNSVVWENSNCGTKNIVRDKYGRVFDPTAVRWLAVLIQKFDAKIVISSDWRYGGLWWIQDLWKFRNLPGEVIDITPVEMEKVNQRRGHEIKTWLDQHPEVDEWVVIDDNYDFTDDMEEHVVIVNELHGLDYKGYTKAYEIMSLNTRKGL